MRAAVPDSLMDEIQQLQDTFGSVTGLAMVLTDQEGNIITRPTIPGLFYQEVLDSLQQNIERPFKYILSRTGSMSCSTVLDEWIPGLKYVISPLFSEYGNVYYLWSGLFMEQGAKDRVLRIFAAEMEHHPDYERLRTELEVMPELRQERIAEIREKLKALGGIICRLLASPAVEPLSGRNDLATWGEGLLRREEQHKELAFLFKEAARMLPQASSRKELASRLLDVIMSLPYNQVSVVVFFQGSGNLESRCFSKGWAEEDSIPYAKDLDSRYSAQAFLSSSIIYENANKQVLLECPLMAENRFKGLLSVGFRSISEAKEWQDYIESFAGLGATAISLIEREDRYRKQAAVFLTNLRHYLLNVNAELHSLSLDAAQMAYDFARYAGLPEEDAERVKRAGLLAPFEMEILVEFGFFPDEVLLLRQIDPLISSSFTAEITVLNLPAQVLAVVLQHSGEEAQLGEFRGSPQKWIDPSRYRLDSAFRFWIDEERYAAFQTFIRNRCGPKPKKRAVTSARLLDNAALKAPKEEWGISPREEEVLELIVNGKTNKEIASLLFISEHTVKNHLSRIFDKMNVTDRSQIIALIYKRILQSERIHI